MNKLIPLQKLIVINKIKVLNKKIELEEETNNLYHNWGRGRKEVIAPNFGGKKGK